MDILLTGGSGDAGSLLSVDLLKRGDNVVSLDLTPPRVPGVQFIEGSILDRSLLQQTVKGVECLVHIAAWHGVHENVRTPAEFHDLNVTGTFNVLEASAQAGIRKFIFVSSTSAQNTNSLYGNTKFIGEEMVKAYAARNPTISFMILRPRAFIPSWNKSVYQDFVEWAAWFLRGAVHIEDFKQALLIAIDHSPAAPVPTYTIDGLHDYSTEDLEKWNEKTFARYYPDFVDLAQEHGLDTAHKPKVLAISPEQRLPGYTPKYSLKNMLEELQAFGRNGPPAPF